MDETAGWRVEEKVKEATYVALEGLSVRKRGNDSSDREEGRNRRCLVKMP